MKPNPSALPWVGSSLISYLNHVDYVPNDDEAMDSLIEQLEIKHLYGDMDEQYWFYDGE